MRIFAIILFLISFGFTQAQNTIKHKVTSGETVYGIAKKYKVKESVIFDANPKIKNKPLQIGTVLSVPNGKYSSNSLPKTHTIEKGDSYYSIAKKYNLKVRDLVEANPKVSPNRLKLGSKLNLQKVENKTKNRQVEKVDEEEIEALEESVYEDLIHVVKKGETLSSISRQYEISVDSLRSLNPNLERILPVNFQLLVKKGLPVETEDEEVVAEIQPENTEVVEEVATIRSTENLTKLEIVLETAKSYLGTRYRYGGRTNAGIDCSGLMCESFNAIDFALPRTSSQQATSYKMVTKKNAQPGDLIFFVTRGKRISHVGLITEISENDIKFIHSSTSSGVIISSLNESYYARRFAHISRVLD